MQLSRLPATWPFQALGDETRLRVARLLLGVGTPLAAGQIAYALNLSPSGLSRHLQILETAGVTERTRRGRSHIISLRTEDLAINKLCECIQALPEGELASSHDLARLLAYEPSP